MVTLQQVLDLVSKFAIVGGGLIISAAAFFATITTP